MLSSCILGGMVIGIVIGIGISQLPFFKKIAGQEAQADVALANAPDQRELPKGELEIIPVSEADYRRGATSPKITIVEYSDPECPFCKMFHESLKKIVAEFPDDVQWVYRQFPLDMHKRAHRESVAMECAGDIAGQDGFWKYLDRLMEVTPANDGLDPKELYKIADFVKLDKARFAECLDSTKFDAKITSHIEDASKNGGNGTPFSVIIAPDGKKYALSGYLDAPDFSRAIKSLLAK